MKAGEEAGVCDCLSQRTAYFPCLGWSPPDCPSTNSQKETISEFKDSLFGICRVYVFIRRGGEKNSVSRPCVYKVNFPYVKYMRMAEVGPAGAAGRQLSVPELLQEVHVSVVLEVEMCSGIYLNAHMKDSLIRWY